MLNLFLKSNNMFERKALVYWTEHSVTQHGIHDMIYDGKLNCAEVSYL